MTEIDGIAMAIDGAAMSGPSILRRPWRGDVPQWACVLLPGIRLIARIPLRRLIRRAGNTYLAGGWSDLIASTRSHVGVLRPSSLPASL